MNRRDFIYAASVGAASATMPTMTLAQSNRQIKSDAPRVWSELRTITLEEHFVSPEWFAGPGREFVEGMRNKGAFGAKIIKQLQDVSDGRIAEMDAAGIDMQVLSLNSPGVEQADVVRMILGGVFDRYPKLQVVLGTWAKAFRSCWRLNRNLPMGVTQLDRPLAAYLRENVHYTFAGFNFPATFLDLLLEVGVERMMFSVDHPYGSMLEARLFLDQIPVSAADRERIAHGNAERLFNI